jgi:hypothetical protein
MKSISKFITLFICVVSIVGLIDAIYEHRIDVTFGFLNTLTGWFSVLMFEMGIFKPSSK